MTVISHVQSVLQTANLNSFYLYPQQEHIWNPQTAADCDVN